MARAFITTTADRRRAAFLRRLTRAQRRFISERQLGDAGLVPGRQQQQKMAGFITDEHLQQAEPEFPGITGLYQVLVEDHRRPRTFLDLVAAWLQADGQVVARCP